MHDGLRRAGLEQLWHLDILYLPADGDPEGSDGSRYSGPVHPRSHLRDGRCGDDGVYLESGQVDISGGVLPVCVYRGVCPVSHGAGQADLLGEYLCVDGGYALGESLISLSLSLYLDLHFS